MGRSLGAHAGDHVWPQVGRVLIRRWLSSVKRAAGASNLTGKACGVPENNLSQAIEIFRKVAGLLILCLKRLVDC